MRSFSKRAGLICLIPVLSWSAEWKVDPNHSTAGFAVRHMMVSTVHGSFSGLKGTVEYDPANLGASKANLTIDATTVDTRNENRDKDLRSAKFFDVEKYPTITFVSKHVIPEGQSKFQLVGDMTMHGVTKEVTFTVEGPMPAVKDAKGSLHSGATATAKINRKDFGLTWSGPLEGGGVTVGDEVELTVEIEMTQAKAT
ncbi:MAG: YceI family protein [Bryobacteraceae bacterium]